MERLMPDKWKFKFVFLFVFAKQSLDRFDKVQSARALMDSMTFENHTD